MTEEEEKDIELIERFHKGILGAEELRLLKGRMAADPSFAQKVEDFRDIFSGIKAHGEEKFSKEVETWEKEIRTERTFSINWKIAAVLLVLIVAGAIYLLYPGQKSTDELYAAYFTPYEDVVSVRGGASPMESYNKKDYANAALQLKEYLNNNPDDLNSAFYLGISLIASGEEQQGIESLDRVIVGNGLLKEQAEWYSALATLKLGDRDHASSQLKAIDHPGHDYQKQAHELLEKL